MKKIKNSSNENKENTQKRRKQSRENSELAKGVEIANEAIKNEKKKKEKKEKKVNKKNHVIKYVLLIIIIAIVVAIYKYRHIIGITLSKEITEEDAIIIETTTSDNKVYAYQSEILVYSKGKIITYNKYGKETWEYSFDETFIPDISISGKYIQVVNKNNGYVYVFNNKYESCRKKIDGTIKKASINAKGDSVIHYSKEGKKSNIGVYDKKGKEKYELTLTTENIAKVALSDSSKYLLFYEVGTQGISANSILKIIDLKKDNNVDTILEVENDIIYDIKLTNSKVYALTTNKVYICNIASNSKKELDISDKNISNISIDSSGISYTHKEISDENNTITILNNMYDVVGTNKLSDNVKYFKYYNSLAYVVGNKDINIYNRWGMHIKKFTSNSIITDPIIFNDGKNIAIPYSNKIVVIGI